MFFIFNSSGLNAQATTWHEIWQIFWHSKEERNLVKVSLLQPPTQTKHYLSTSPYHKKHYQSYLIYSHLLLSEIHIEKCSLKPKNMI